MNLSQSEELLVESFRRLPAPAARELAALAQRLASLGLDSAIDWSDEWSEADLREFTRGSLRRLDAEDRDRGQ